MIFDRILALIVGYGFGLIQSGYILGRFNKIDLREHGSGNSGATNALRVLGKKAGLIVFLGDFLKALLPCLAFRLFFRDSHQINNILVLLYCGLGVVLGHSYPFHMGFRGGKGVASIAGIIGSLDLMTSIVCILVFVLTVMIKKYVSLASILVMLALILCTWSNVVRGNFGLLNHREICILITIIGGLSIYRHKDNIRRLLNGTENKIGAKC